MPQSPAGSATPNLLVIGGGNMGSAIVLGALHATVITSEKLLVAEPDAAKREGLQHQGVRAVASASEGLAWANTRDTQVVLAIKPQMLPTLASECLPQFSAAKIIISIMAGTPGTKVQALLGATHRVVRAMPSLPASIGLSTTAICLSAGARAGDDAFARKLFAAIGPSVLTTREEQMDTFTAVAGSGPAYLFYLAEAMQRAAVADGFDEATAAEMTRSSLLGAATMLAQSKLPAAALRQQVTSKGGTTEAAIGIFENLKVSESIERGIAAGTQRAHELSK